MSHHLVEIMAMDWVHAPGRRRSTPPAGRSLAGRGAGSQARWPLWLTAQARIDHARGREGFDALLDIRSRPEAGLVDESVPMLFFAGGSVFVKYVYIHAKDWSK